MIEFTAPPVSAPDGSIIGVIEEPAGVLSAQNIARIGIGNALPDVPGNYILDHALCRSDAVAKAQAISQMLRLRRAGATLALISHDELLLESCADEIWWIRQGALAQRGDPAEVLAHYRHHVAGALRAAGRNQLPSLAPTMRNGDGRAVLERVELLGENGDPATVFQSGEQIAVRVTVRFVARVEDPVVGIMIRTRIGLNVYGTNTELEQVRFGPVQGGSAVRIAYRFRCDLCPGDYTVTAASHDPDGVWHDWLEDAVAFAVADSRYTAGVAKLNSTVELVTEPYGQSAST